MDRGKAASKRYFVSDRGGVPLAVVLSAANIRDSKVFEELIDAVEPIASRAGVDHESAPRSCTSTRDTTSPLPKGAARPRHQDAHCQEG